MSRADSAAVPRRTCANVPPARVFFSPLSTADNVATHSTEVLTLSHIHSRITVDVRATHHCKLQPVTVWEFENPTSFQGHPWYLRDTNEKIMALPLCRSPQSEVAEKGTSK